MNRAQHIEPNVPVKTRAFARKFGVDKQQGFLNQSEMQHNSVIADGTIIHKLQKGKYDIHYVITLLKIILGQKPHLGLQHSITRLLAMLEVERDQMSAPPRKTLNKTRDLDIVV